MEKSKTSSIGSFCMIALALLLFSCKPGDSKIRDNVNERLQESHRGVTAEVTDGVVTLSGSCEGENCATTAEQQAAEVSGVKSVNNNIQAQTGTDLTLRTSVQAIISRYPGVQADVAGGNVVLRGTVTRDLIQPLMTELQALRPKQIDNQLAVQ
jgi:hypothetical protein